MSTVSSLPKFGHQLTDKPVGVGGSMKASHETQDSKDHSQKSSDRQEAMVFEATGGNTILAAEYVGFLLQYHLDTDYAAVLPLGQAQSQILTTGESLIKKD